MTGEERKELTAEERKELKEDLKLSDEELDKISGGLYVRNEEKISVRLLDVVIVKDPNLKFEIVAAEDSGLEVGNVVINSELNINGKITRLIDRYRQGTQGEIFIFDWGGSHSVTKERVAVIIKPEN